mgnify:CR=1 FL=1
MPRLPLKALLGAIAVISFLGFSDASYLAAEHYLGATPACSILEGCETVTKSGYATVEGTFNALTGGDWALIIPRGISVALLGGIYYLIFFVASVAAWDGQNRWIFRIAPFSVLGLAASAWFLYAQAALLKAFCLYCIVSAATSALLFVVAAILIQWDRSRRRAERAQIAHLSTK